MKVKGMVKNGSRVERVERVDFNVYPPSESESPKAMPWQG